MYSLNVPVPGVVSELAWSLRSRLLGFEELRDEHTLVVKRLQVDSREGFHERERAVRAAVHDTPPFELAVTGIGVFTSPPTSPSPVVYFEVESPGVRALHRDLVEAFGAVKGIEGAGYVPHITLARGGSREAVESITSTDLETITWTADRLLLWDGARDLPAGEIALPA